MKAFIYIINSFVPLIMHNSQYNSIQQAVHDMMI